MIHHEYTKPYVYVPSQQQWLLKVKTTVEVSDQIEIPWRVEAQLYWSQGTRRRADAETHIIVPRNMPVLGPPPTTLGGRDMSNHTQNIMDWLDLPDHRSRIARAPVTNRQWKKFLEESGYNPSQDDHDGDYLNHWQDGQPPEDQLDEPVVYVSYINAWAFCDFYGYRLPTEQEIVIIKDYGIWEWFGCRPPVRRGGSFLNGADYVRCACRDGNSPQDCYGAIGFRPAQDMQNTAETDTITVPRELYDWLVEHALALKGEWEWKQRSQLYRAEYDRLVVACVQAVELRDR